MSKKSLTKNYLLDLVYRIITLIVPIVTAPYVSRHIGAVGIGNYSYTGSICSYFCFLAILGSNVYGQREIAVCNGDRVKISNTFWSIYVIRFVCTLATAIIYILFAMRFSGEIKILLLLQLVDIIGLLFDITWLYQGLEEFGRILARNLVMKAISVMSIFLLVRTEKDLYIYILMTSVANVASNLLLFVPLKKHVDIVRIPAKSILKHIIPIIKLFIPTIALNVYNQIDKTMLGYLSVPEEAGYYEQSTKIIVIINTFVTSVCNIMSPRISSLIETGDIEKTKQLNKKTYDLIWTLALPIVFGLFVISDDFVPLFFGQGFAKVSTLLKILSIVCIPMGIKMVLGMQILVPNKMEGLYTLSILGGIGINILLNAVLIVKCAAIGASVASVLSEIAIVIFLLVKLRDTFDFKDVFTGFTKKIAASAVMVIIIRLVVGNISDSLIRLSLSISVGACCYFLGLLVLRDNLMMQILKKIRHILRI